MLPFLCNAPEMERCEPYRRIEGGYIENADSAQKCFLQAKMYKKIIDFLFCQLMFKM